MRNAGEANRLCRRRVAGAGWGRACAEGLMVAVVSAPLVSCESKSVINRLVTAEETGGAGGKEWSRTEEERGRSAEGSRAGVAGLE